MPRLTAGSPTVAHRDAGTRLTPYAMWSARPPGCMEGGGLGFSRRIYSERRPRRTTCCHRFVTSCVRVRAIANERTDVCTRSTHHGNSPASSQLQHWGSPDVDIPQCLGRSVSYHIQCNKVQSRWIEAFQMARRLIRTGTGTGLYQSSRSRALTRRIKSTTIQ